MSLLLPTADDILRGAREATEPVRGPPGARPWPDFRTGFRWLSALGVPLVLACDLPDDYGAIRTRPAAGPGEAIHRALVDPRGRLVLSPHRAQPSAEPICARAYGASTPTPYGCLARRADWRPPALAARRPLRHALAFRRRPRATGSRSPDRPGRLPRPAARRGAAAGHRARGGAGFRCSARGRTRRPPTRCGGAAPPRTARLATCRRLRIRATSRGRRAARRRARLRSHVQGARAPRPRRRLTRAPAAVASEHARRPQVHAKAPRLAAPCPTRPSEAPPLPPAPHPRGRRRTPDEAARRHCARGRGSRPTEGPPAAPARVAVVAHAAGVLVDEAGRLPGPDRMRGECMMLVVLPSGRTGAVGGPWAMLKGLRWAHPRPVRRGPVDARRRGARTGGPCGADRRGGRRASGPEAAGVASDDLAGCAPTKCAAAGGRAAART